METAQSLYDQLIEEISTYPDKSTYVPTITEALAYLNLNS